MKIKLDRKEFTVLVRGSIEDGPVIPEETGLPWPGQITGFEATMCHTGAAAWMLRDFTCLIQEMDKHGNVDPDDSFRYRRRYESPRCPGWVHRLAERLIPLGTPPLVLPQEFYLV